MPGGDVHLSLWKKGIPLSAIGSGLLLAASQDPYMAGAAAAGYLLGRYISPDLDLIGLSSDEGRMMQELKVFGLFVVMWFMPYAYIMRFVGIGRKGHRNFFSHFPFISTFIRLAWLLGPFIAAVYYWEPGLVQANIDWLYSLSLGIFLGHSLSDLIHYLADMGYIRYRRRKWKITLF